MTTTYHEAFPSSTQNSFTNEAVDFIIQPPLDSEIVKGSFVVQGDLKMEKAGAQIAYNDKIYFDHHAGVSCFFDSFTVQLESGVTETRFLQYARYEKMRTLCMTTSDELITDSKHNIQWKCASDLQTVQILRGDNAATHNLSFSFAPSICLNRSSRNMLMSEVGTIKLTIILQNPIRAVYGADVTPANNITYSITNLRVQYQSIPAESHSDKLLFNVTSMNKYTINSKQANVDMILPIPTQTMSCTFARDADLLPTAKGQQSIYRPTVNRLIWRFNDENKRLLSYNLESPVEILANYKSSMSTGDDSEIDDLRLTDITSNYGVGINFGGTMTKGNKVSLEIDSNADSTNPLQLFCYFRGLVGVN